MRLLLLAVIMTSATTTNCPLPTQRYDVAEFPPRCIDCPQIVSNQMPLARIATQLAVQRAAVKFSPGLPQNDTCGCWRAANQTVVNVTLNASWIVSGLLWDNDRGRWLRQVSVRASEDGVVFVGLGNYTYANHTAAAVMLFAAPVRARVFEVSVLRYANHYVNTSTGFALAAPTALVSQTQPFTCACPLPEHDRPQRHVRLVHGSDADIHGHGRRLRQVPRRHVRVHGPLRLQPAVQRNQQHAGGRTPIRRGVLDR